MRLATLLRPRYLFDRIQLYRYQKSHPDHPWLTQQAISILESRLKPSDIGLEWGSGRSTAWFARRIAKLVSVESDPAWYKRVRGMVSTLPNVDLRLLPEQDAYVGVTDQFPPESFDFILVDGMLARDQCAHRALRLLRPGGLLVLDNANWYLPCASRAPGTRTAAGPRRADSDSWDLFTKKVAHWRGIWTSNGAWDTALWIKGTALDPRGQSDGQPSPTATL